MSRHVVGARKTAVSSSERYLSLFSIFSHLFSRLYIDASMFNLHMFAIVTIFQEREKERGKERSIRVIYMQFVYIFHILNRIREIFKVIRLSERISNFYIRISNFSQLTLFLTIK